MKIKVIYDNLSRSKAWGMAHSDGNKIVLEKKLKGKKHLEIINHELLHILFPEMSEEEVIEKSITLTNILWKEGYRRVDNSNTILLQNGKKS